MTDLQAVNKPLARISPLKRFLRPAQSLIRDAEAILAACAKGNLTISEEIKEVPAGSPPYVDEESFIYRVTDGDKKLLELQEVRCHEMKRYDTSYYIIINNKVRVDSKSCRYGVRIITKYAGAQGQLIKRARELYSSEPAASDCSQK